MDRITTWARENPQFAGILFFSVVLTFLLGLFAWTMLRTGASLRPLIWFAGFFGIVAGPQLVVHLCDGFILSRARNAGFVELPATPARKAVAPALTPVPWETVFGPDADPGLTVDPKISLAPVLKEAREAKLSFRSSGDSALAARFDSPEAALRALNRYGEFFAFAHARGSDATGWTGQRHSGEGEWVHMVVAGSEFYAWTSASRATALENRARALGPATDADDTTFIEQPSPVPQLASTRLKDNWRVMVLMMTLNLAAAVGWFFKGSAWAGRVEAPLTAQPAAVQTLRDSVLALNDRDLPTQATLRPDGGIEIDWRYADARWFDLMNVHQMRRTHRLVLSFDEAARIVRVREYWSEFDGSAGRDGLQLNWKMQTGIQFFAYNHQRVLGVQLGPDGKPTGELSKAYTFDLQALKRPIIEAVTGSGWKWQPVAWNAPSWLRWATE